MIKKQFYEDVVFRTAKDFAANISCPTLVVSGANDEAVSQSHADRYLKIIGAKVKKMEIIEGSDHNYNGEALSKLVPIVANWFSNNLV